MIPSINILTDKITERVYPNKTHKIVFGLAKSQVKKGATLGRAILGQMILGVTESDALSSSEASDRIIGYTDGFDALKQAIYLILSTERYQYPIYSWDYGVELFDLIGKPMPYVMAEVPRRITEALTQDDRIDDVTDFEFIMKGRQIGVTFNIISTIGNIATELEVEF